ncbi:MAG: D-alanyl-D-alanine carboxypeptidase/D-alanyl-D-alanine-endopeptidase [Ignavibacteriaceae bacterium]|nr:D-alanyl-D-alanine carboxypeptidase/D-alanyl-D-alanine-endopeptidase [Ignavibacteriaceae bacterium]
MKFKLFVISAVLLFSFLQIKAQDKAALLKSQIDQVLSDPFFESCIGAVKVYDLTGNTELYRRNDKLLLTPASNMKVITSSAALIYLGENYKFVTPFYYTGEIKNGILEGDLFVKGAGDPLFKASDLDAAISELAKKGVKEIKGALCGDISLMDSMYWGQGWMWDDDPSTDAPYLSPLTINKNTLNVTVTGGAAGDTPSVKLFPETPYFSVVNKARSVPYPVNDLAVTRNYVKFSNDVFISGDIQPGYAASYNINFREPEIVFLHIFKARLEKAGIKVAGDPAIRPLPEDAVYLTGVSRPLIEVIDDLNKVSANINAEMLLIAMGGKTKKSGISFSDGKKYIDSLIILTGMNPENYYISDGSGVSRYNLVTAELLTAILKYYYYSKPSLYPRLLNSFPIAGVDGTLRSRMTNTIAYQRVKAKTGTLSGVVSLSGYTTTLSGKTLAFSVILENFVVRTNTARSYIDRICEIITGY